MTRRWTEAEDFLILDTAHLSAKQVGAMLGRTHYSVEDRRKKLRGREGVMDFGGRGNPKGQNHLEPWKVGRRSLVARTCLLCDRLLDSSWFRREAASVWVQSCRQCETGRRHTGSSDDRQMEQRLQAFTKERADRNGAEYTEADLAILADTSKSLFRMALETRRTMTAVKNARSSYGLADRGQPALGDPSEAQWIIRFPEEVAA